MDLDIIALYALAVIGPIMIFLTHFIVKGRGKDMTRLWFITFFAYMIYYILAESGGMYSDPREMIYSYALLWPIAAILAFWIAQILTKNGRFVPFFEMMIAFVVGVFFTFLLDGLGGIFHWYTYVQPASATVVQKTWFANPIGGLLMPSIVPFLMGILMIFVFFAVFNLYKELRKRHIDDTSATLLLAFLSVFVGGALWVITGAVQSFVAGIV